MNRLNNSSVSQPWIRRFDKKSLRPVLKRLCFFSYLLRPYNLEMDVSFEYRYAWERWSPVDVVAEIFKFELSVKRFYL
jgi:hypothetical protein